MSEEKVVDITPDDVVAEDVASTVVAEESVFDKLRQGKFTFHFPELDKFCFGGVVIDEAKVEGQKVVDAGMEENLNKGKEFAAEQSDFLSSKSVEVGAKVKEGVAACGVTLADLPGLFSEKWNEAKEKYHEHKKKEAAAALEEEEPAELALR